MHREIILTAVCSSLLARPELTGQGRPNHLVSEKERLAGSQSVFMFKLSASALFVCCLKIAGAILFISSIVQTAV